MASFKLVVLKVANALAKKKFGPVKLVQTIHLPLGPMHIVGVGDIRKGLLPSAKDLKLVQAAIAKAAKGIKPTAYSTVIFPPIIKVSQVFLPKGAFYLVELGSLANSIMPDTKDLENTKDLMGPEFERMGLKDPSVLFFPPVLKLAIVDGWLVATLGDIEHNIEPSKKDALELKRLILAAIKPLKFTKVMVTSATGGFRSKENIVV